MTQDVHGQVKHSVDGDGQQYVRQSGQTKQRPAPINLPAIAQAQKTFGTSLPVPKVEAAGNDRQSRREANQAQRELNKIALLTQKAGLAIESVRAVNTFAAHSFDVGQDEIMGIYYGRDRYQDTSEVTSQVMGQRIHAMGVQQATVIELYFKRLAEEF